MKLTTKAISLLSSLAFTVALVQLPVNSQFIKGNETQELSSEELKYKMLIIESFVKGMPTAGVKIRGAIDVYGIIIKKEGNYYLVQAVCEAIKTPGRYIIETYDGLKYEVTIDRPKCNQSNEMYFQFSSVENYSIIPLTAGIPQLGIPDTTPKIDKNLSNTRLINSDRTSQVNTTYIEKIAQEITVKIDGIQQGTGVIVKKEGNIYTVLTDCTVVPTGGNYTIQTYDNKKYSVTLNPPGCTTPTPYNRSLKFTSDINYRVADLGNSLALNQGSKIYVAGWTEDNNTKHERVYKFQEGMMTGKDINAKNAYILTHNVGPQMRGGAILDERGKLVGINGIAAVEADPRIPVIEFLAVPISAGWQGEDYAAGFENVIKRINPDAPSLSQSNPNNYPIATDSNSDYILEQGFNAHTQEIVGIIFFPDSKQLITATENEIKVWNLETESLIKKIDKGVKNKLFFITNGKQVAWRHEDKSKELVLVNLKDGSSEILTEDNDIIDAAFSPDGGKLAISTYSEVIKIKVINLANSKTEKTFVTSDSMGGLTAKIVFNLDSNKLVRISLDIPPQIKIKIKIWNLENNQLEVDGDLGNLPSNSNIITPRQLTGFDGQKVFFCEKRYDLKNSKFEEIKHFVTSTSMLLPHVSCNYNGEKYATGTFDGYIHVWQRKH